MPMIGRKQLNSNSEWICLHRYRSKFKAAPTSIGCAKHYSYYLHQLVKLVLLHYFCKSELTLTALSQFSPLPFKSLQAAAKPIWNFSVILWNLWATALADAETVDNKETVQQHGVRGSPCAAAKKSKQGMHRENRILLPFLHHQRWKLAGRQPKIRL